MELYTHEPGIWNFANMRGAWEIDLYTYEPGIWNFTHMSLRGGTLQAVYY